MDAQTKEQIYDDLLKIELEISFDRIPDPDKINELIGQCHVFMGQVEKLGIKVNKEISINQRMLTDALSHYEFLRQDLMANRDEIRKLPNIKDREAAADSHLKDNLNSIRKYKNELSDLKNLARVINLKEKNLYRVNNDIKLQVRLMESQIKLDGMTRDDPAARSLAEEYKKSTINRDLFEDCTTSEEEPPIDDENSDDIDKVLDDSLVSPDHQVSSEVTESQNASEGSTPVPPIKEEHVDAKPEEEVKDTGEEGLDWAGLPDETESSEEILCEVDLSIQKMASGIEDLFKEEKNTGTKQTITQDKEPVVEEAPKSPPTSVGVQTGGIDIDSLLKGFN